ncbi:MAG: hypothetical protein ACOX68_01245 [Candidatus Limivicinus sp.]|jgi:hypothetical protein
MRKIALFAAAALILSLLLCGCGGTETKDSSLLQEGLEVADLMREMAESEEYLAASTGSAELRKKIDEALEESYTDEEPEAVYELKISPEDIISAAAGGDGGDMSPELRAALTARGSAALASHINARGGAELLAAASLCMAEKSFVNTEFSGSTVYLYMFENSVPVMVSFTAGDDGAVTATGSFILTEDFRPENEADVEAYFDRLPVEAEKIENLTAPEWEN